jgi:hypothetical protein
MADADAEELAFYRTSTSMLVLLLFLSAALHCWTWAEATRDAERRQEAHFRNQRKKKGRRSRNHGENGGEGEGSGSSSDEFGGGLGGDELPEWGGDEDAAERREYRRKGLRPPPIVAYGGSSYGTKKPTAPVAAAAPNSPPGLAGRLLARGKRGLLNGVAAARRPRKRGGYAPVHAGSEGALVEDGFGDGNGLGVEMATVKSSRSASWDDGEGEGDADENEEGFEERFRRMDRERAALAQRALNDQVHEASSHPGAFLGGLLRAVLSRTGVVSFEDGGHANDVSGDFGAAARGGGPPPGSGLGGEEDGSDGSGEPEEEEAEMNPFSFSSAGDGADGETMFAPLEVAAVAIRAQAARRAATMAGAGGEVSPRLEY